MKGGKINLACTHMHTCTPATCMPSHAFLPACTHACLLLRLTAKSTRTFAHTCLPACTPHTHAHTHAFIFYTHTHTQRRRERKNPGQWEKARRSPACHLSASHTTHLTFASSVIIELKKNFELVRIVDCRSLSIVVSRKEGSIISALLRLPPASSVVRRRQSISHCTLFQKHLVSSSQ